MSFPTVFATLPGLPSTNPASLIDTMFNVCGGMGNIPCTAAGTNAYTLTPNTNFYLPAAYANYQTVTFLAPNSSTGACTIRIGALAFVNLYNPNGIQSNNGDIVANNKYVCIFASDLNTGAGGFLILNSSVPNPPQQIQGSFKNLKIVIVDNVVTAAVTADQVILQNNTGGTAKVSTVSIPTLNGSVNGANGLDTGALAGSTWYYIYVIFAPSGPTTAGLLSLSATAPTLPATYTYFARVGAAFSNPGATGFNGLTQYGRRAQWTTTAGRKTAASGIAGDPTIPTWVAVNLANFVPTTATRVSIYANSPATNSSVIVAPNSAYGTNRSALNPAPITVSQLGAVLASAGSPSLTAEMAIESLGPATIQWASNSASGNLLVLGWEDNI